MDEMIKISMSLKHIFLCRKKSHKGFVLVSVLMLGVMLISCATAFAWFVRTQVRSVGRERESITNRSMAEVVTGSLINALAMVANNVEYDSPTQEWYFPFVVPFPDLGPWVVQVTPLDDKLPIRNFFLPDGNTLRHEFEEPLQNMWEKLNHRELELVMLDFLDRNNRPRVGGVERDDFINRGPYDLSELLILSREITPDILYGSGGQLGIADYCTVYSEGKINLNVAPVHVMELLPGLDERGLAERIAEARTQEPLKNFRDLQSLPGASPRTSTLLTNIASFKSRYFNVMIQCLETESTGGTSFNIIFDRNTRQIVRWEEI